jgi:acetate---CoA ligase (ADP-forming)
LLDKLFNPGSVAVVGASRDRHKVGHSIMANLTGKGFTGRVYPVNPSAKSIAGHRCHPSVNSIPGVVDMAVIAVPAKLVPSVMQDCGAKGVGTAIIISAGFRETGEHGKALEKTVMDIAAAHGIRVLGPNCLGIINTANGLNASFAQASPKKGKIAFFSQSGALCTAILDWSLESGVGFSKFVSLGNKADISELEMLRYLADDADTRVILGYIEGVENGREFMEVARRAVRKTPVILAKSGGTSAGARAASSHTGTLAGSEQAFEAAFKQTGILRAGTIEELFNSALAFAGCPIPRSPNLAVVTNAGGPGIIAADACERSRAKMAGLGTATVKRLRKCLPASSGFFNPVDVLGDADAKRYECALKSVLKDPAVGGVLAVLTPQAMTDVDGTAECIARLKANSAKPVLASFMGGVSIKNGVGMLEGAGVPVYGYPEEGVKAFESLVRYKDGLASTRPRFSSFDADRVSAKAAMDKARAAGRKELGEGEAREVISAYGFRVPRNRLAVTSGEAVSAARDIGFPVALKISSPDILHKSDVGGVRLGLKTPAEVSTAFLEITSNASRLVPDALIRGCMVQEMAGPGREVILGMSKDPQFGPLIMFGMGGIYVEALKDVSFRIAPLGADDAVEMMEEVKGFRILHGLRGEKPSDISAVREAILRLSQLAVDFPDVVEMDINPFIVLGEGEGAVAADARLTLE